MKLLNVVGTDRSDSYIYKINLFYLGRVDSYREWNYCYVLSTLRASIRQIVIPIFKKVGGR